MRSCGSLLGCHALMQQIDRHERVRECAGIVDIPVYDAYRLLVSLCCLSPLSQTLTFACSYKLSSSGAPLYSLACRGLPATMR